MREIDFGRNVGKWQSELLDLLRNMKVFEEVYPQSYAKERISPQHPYLDAVFSSLAYAEETGLSVLSDDRMMQMLRTPQISNRQFGTDALLADLLENEIITEEEYARCFLQLCQWRYRFLMPDVRLLLYLVKEHKQNPLGKSLYDIAEYSHQCMQDPGLFLGLEPTEPPTPLGVKLYKEWVFAWGDFLLHVWQDDDFSVENAHQITQKVFQQALPGPPRYLTDEVRKKCTTAIEAGIIKHLFVNASYCMEPLRLNGLFNQTFALLGYDELKREAELRAHLEFLLDFFSENGKEYGEEKTVLLEDYIIRSLIAFFGEEQPRISDPSIISILDNIGLNRQQPKVPDEYHYPLNQLPAIISSRDTFSERQPIS